MLKAKTLMWINILIAVSVLFVSAQSILLAPFFRFWWEKVKRGFDIYNAPLSQCGECDILISGDIISLSGM